MTHVDLRTHPFTHTPFTLVQSTHPLSSQLSPGHVFCVHGETHVPSHRCVYTLTLVRIHGLRLLLRCPQGGESSLPQGLSSLVCAWGPPSQQVLSLDEPQSPPSAFHPPFTPPCVALNWLRGWHPDKLHHIVIIQIRETEAQSPGRTCSGVVEVEPQLLLL